MSLLGAPREVYQYYETAIIEGSLRVGDRLPSERALAQQFGISRSSVREAILSLNAKGWVMSKRGGGHYVSKQLQQEMAEPLIKILNNNAEAHFDLLEFRYNMEGDCAHNAALRANDIDLKALTKAYENLKKAHLQQSIDHQASADAAFHLAIAEASHNVIYLHLMTGLLTALRVNMHSSISKIFESKLTRDTLMNQHTAIFDAIIHRQPATARAAAEQHITYVRATLIDFVKDQSRLERSHRRHR